MLGTHLGKLEAAGYIAVDKRFVDRKPVSHYRITPTDQKAFRRYLERIEAVLKASQESAGGT